MKKKTVALILALVLVFGAAVGGTIAYLTSTKSVENTFTVGKVEITLDEAQVNDMGQPVDNDGKVVEKAAAPRVDHNEYKLIPGHTYTKDPTIHVAADSEDCYLFVKIVNQLGTAAPLNMGEKWSLVNGSTDTYMFAEKVSAEANVVVFDGFTFSSDVNAENLPGYNAKTITVTACAVQADGFATAQLAYAAANFGA